MNTKINDLIKQSYVTVQFDNGEGYTHFSQEKFAELIVRECMDVADNTAMGESTYGWMVANQIKEHFGVEE